jgi:hypothetical protein
VGVRRRYRTRRAVGGGEVNTGREQYLQALAGLRETTRTQAERVARRHCCIERSPFPAASTRPLNTADGGHDRVFQVILSGLAIGRASTPLPFADAFRLNATVPYDAVLEAARARLSA